MLGFLPDDYKPAPSQPSPRQRATSQAVAEQDWNTGNLFPFLTNLLMVSPSGNGGSIATSDQVVSLAGPSALPTAYWVRRDHVAPSVPADVAWTSSNDATPKTMLLTTTLDAESILSVQPFTSIAEAGAVIGENAPAFDPIVAGWLGQAMTVEMGRVFSASSNTNTDPVHPIGSYSGIGRETLGTTIGWTALSEGYGSIVADGRYQPTVAWVSPQSYTILRNERSASGQLLHQPGRPMLLDTLVNADGRETRVPVLPLRGIPEGNGSFCLIADAKRIVAVHREVAPGLLVRVDTSSHMHFNADQVVFRMTRRLDFGIPAGHERAVLRLDCVTPAA